jgi:LysM repeat protein
MNIFRAILTIVAILMGSFVAVHPNSADAAVLSSYIITIPDAGSSQTILTQPVAYTVKSGDTLSAIARRYNADWEGLYCFNEKTIGLDPNSIKPGERLIIEVSKCHINHQDGTTTATASYVVTGSPQQIAWNLLSPSNRAAEFSCLKNIIDRESGWRINAFNPSGAYGIPQALPGSKMGPGWQYSAYVQLYWMIKVYIPAQYGTPCDAWGFWQAHSWY